MKIWLRRVRADTPASSPKTNGPQQQKALEQAISGFDVVITTALVPGRPAPRLVTAAAVEAMKPGSVVVDLAGETGGNCELTEPGQVVVKHDVTIASPLNLPATMPEHASELYSKNITALLDLLINDGKLAPDFDDEVVAESCVTRETGAGDDAERSDAVGAPPAGGGERRETVGGTRCTTNYWPTWRSWCCPDSSGSR